MCAYILLEPIMMNDCIEIDYFHSIDCVLIEKPDCGFEIGTIMTLVSKFHLDN